VCDRFWAANIDHYWLAFLGSDREGDSVGDIGNGLDQHHFLDVYEEYVKVAVEPARYQLRSLLSRMRRAEYWDKLDAGDQLFSPSPLQSSMSRIKRPESALDKMIRKPDHYDRSQPLIALRAMHDVLGGRIVTYFVSDLALIDRAVRSEPSLEICPDDPPVDYLESEVLKRLGIDHFTRVEHRPSGYTSLHYVVRFRESAGAVEQPWFELQVRTLAEHAWAEVQHILGYKLDSHVPLFVERQLELLAKNQAVFDEELELLRAVLDGVALRGDLVADGDYITAGNLPALLQDAGLRIPRDWASETLKLLHSRGLDLAGKFRRLLHAESIGKLINEVYQQELGRPPRDMERISTLANLADILDAKPELSHDQMAGRIRAQLDFDRQWQELLLRLPPRQS
jgi:ppGpp synthetase/RelA/SpoT-type nucleotidyltranferase